MRIPSRWLSAAGAKATIAATEVLARRYDEAFNRRDAAALTIPMPMAKSSYGARDEACGRPSGAPICPAPES